MKTILICAALIMGQVTYGQISDIDGNEYSLTDIASTTWTTENLRVQRFSNGDTILLANTKSEWITATNNKIPACAYYDFDPANGNEHGLLYNWHAVNDARGLAPDGFHIPSREEYLTVIDTLGGDVHAGNSMKSSNGWKDNWPFGLKSLRFKKHNDGTPYHVGNGTNSSGFNALPSGGINSQGESEYMGIFGHYWTTTAPERTALDDKYNQPDKAYFFDLKYHEGGCGEGSAHWGIFFQSDGMSVRCVKD